MLTPVRDEMTQRVSASRLEWILAATARRMNGRMNARAAASCSRDDEEGDGAVVDDGDGLAANPPASVLRHWWRPWGDDSRSVMLCFCDITSFKSLRTWLRLLIMVRSVRWFGLDGR